MKRGLIYGLIIVCISFAVLRRCNRDVDNRISSPVLKSDEQAKVILDPRKRTATTVQRTHTGTVTKQTYLPPHTTAITVDAKGNVKFNSRVGGTEYAPFIGFAYSDKARLLVGVNLLYYRAWEGGLAVAPTMSGAFSIRLALVASYNVYSNTSLFVGVTHQKEPIGGIAWRF